MTSVSSGPSSAARTPDASSLPSQCLRGDDDGRGGPESTGKWPRGSPTRSTGWSLDGLTSRLRNLLQKDFPPSYCLCKFSCF